MKNKLINQIKKKKAIIGIIGLGYIGLPLALRFAEVGFDVVGIDIDSKKIKMLNKGISYIDDISHNQINKEIKKNLKVTSDFSIAKYLDVMIICVPTPLKKNSKPDLSFVTNTMDILKPYFRKNQVLSLESTTYPGTTDEVLLPRIEKTGLKVGKDFFLLYSPEREDPGNLEFKTRSIPKILGGYSSNCLEVGKVLYASAIDKVIPVSSTKVAEMTKLLENIHRAVNIGLVNEMKIVCDAMNIDIYEVIKAAATKPFGFTPYYPGPGLGGHCIPIDPFYLTWKANQIGVDTRFIKLAGEINTSMPFWIVKKVNDTLRLHNKSIRGSKILILGIAFKKNVQDTRESPGIELLNLFKKKGALIDYSDPHVPTFPKIRKYNFNLSSVKLTPSSIKKYDLVLIATDHIKFNYSMIQKSAKIIVDTRGVYTKKFKNVIKA